MSAYISELVFNCTAAQFATMCSTTLPAAGFKVIQAPNKFQGLIIGSAAFTFTATTASTTALTAVSSLVGLYPGIAVSGAGIPAGDTLSAIGATNTATLAVAATASAADVTITATPNLGQLDFSYDGAYFVRFFGANPAPVSQQASVGVPRNQMSANLINVLTGALAATLGAPVPVNQVVPPSGA
jgi:hypothetical protein